jgi:hypothetical protein
MVLDQLKRRILGPRSRITSAELNRLRPVRNPQCEVLPTDDSGLVLVLPVPPDNRFWRRWFPARPDFRFELEPVGAFVWHCCDGRHSFRAISRKLAARYKMSRIEADASLSAFLTMLAKRKLVALIGKE